MPKKSQPNTTRKTKGQGSGQGSGQLPSQPPLNYNFLQDLQQYGQLLNPNLQFNPNQNLQFNPNQQFNPNPQFNPNLQTQQFPPLYNQNQQFNLTQQSQQLWDDEDDDEDDEEVPETQHDSRQKKKKFESRAPSASWGPIDEERLAKAWVYVSTSKIGTDQKRESFWNRILKHYISLGGDASRSHHACNTKWNKMNTEMTFYNGLHIQAERLVASGCNDLDVKKRADADYLKTRGKGFKHEMAWDVVKVCDKWKKLALFGETASGSSSGQKRKSAESMADQTASNDDDFDFDSHLPDMNEDPSPTISRKSKKKQSESETLDGIMKNLSGYTLTKTTLFEEQAARKKEKDEMIMKDLSAKMRARDLKIFLEPHDNITNPRLLAFTIQTKSEIADRYGWDKYWEEA